MSDQRKKPEKLSVGLAAMAPEDRRRAAELLGRVGPEAVELAGLYLKVYEEEAQGILRHMGATGDQLRWGSGVLHVVLAMQEDLRRDLAAR